MESRPAAGGAHERTAMQPTVLLPVLDALRDVVAGPPWDVLGGLRAVPLLAPGDEPLDRQGPALVMVDSPMPLEWRELSPAAPRRIELTNRGGRPVVVDAGTVLHGGMSARAVREVVVAPPGAVVGADVEPVGARWWDEGALWSAGPLEPVALALLLQCVHGDAVSACSARTALSSLAVDALIDRSHGLGQAGARGWVLELRGEVFAAWLRLRPAARAGRLAMVHDDTGPPAGTAAAAVWSTVHRGSHTVRLVAPGTATGMLIIVPRDLRLVDQVTAAQSVDSAPR